MLTLTPIRNKMMLVKRGKPDNGMTGRMNTRKAQVTEIRVVDK